MQSCQMAADAVVYGMGWAPPNVDKRWALGVASMVGWARGASRQTPVPLPGDANAA